MSVIAETRILPEDLAISWQRIHTALAADPVELP
jgi:hypothetical protein